MKSDSSDHSDCKYCTAACVTGQRVQHPLFIYIVQNEKQLKVGLASNPINRVHRLNNRPARRKQHEAKKDEEAGSANKVDWQKVAILGPFTTEEQLKVARAVRGMWQSRSEKTVSALVRLLIAYVPLDSVAWHADELKFKALIEQERAARE